MVEFAWIYGPRTYHTKGYCWHSEVIDNDMTHSLNGERAYYYDCPSDPGRLLYCEDCLREMGVLW